MGKMRVKLAHMPGVQGQPAIMGPEGCSGENAFSALGCIGVFPPDGGDGQGAAMAGLQKKLGIFPAMHHFGAEGLAAPGGAPGPEAAEKRIKQHHKQEQADIIIQHAPDGKGTKPAGQQGGQHAQAPARHALPVGTGTASINWESTCWADTPFIRASGVRIRRWESTGSAMRRISSGKT